MLKNPAITYLPLVTSLAAAGLAFLIALALARPLGARVAAARRSATPWIWGLAAALFVFLALASVARHNAFATRAADLGEYANVIYNFGCGRFFEQYVVLSEHGRPLTLTPLLATLGPLARIFPDPAYLLVLQAAILAGGVMLVYAAARTDGDRGWWAAALAASLAFAPAYIGIGFNAGIPRAVALPFILAAYLFFGRRRFGAGMTFLALAALCREDAALHAIGLALFGGFVCGRRRAGVIAAAALAAYFLGIASFLYPRLTQPSATPYFVVFAKGPGTTPGLAPYSPPFLSAKLGYIAAQALPAAIPLAASGAGLLSLLTPLAVPLTAVKGGIFGLGTQYPAAILPFVYGAAAYGLRRLAAGDARRRRWAAVGALTALGAQILLGAFWYPRLLGPRLRECRGGARAAALAAAVAQVPKDAVVVADERIAPHLCHRRYDFLWAETATYPLPAAPEILLVERPPVQPADPADALAAAAYWRLPLTGCSPYHAYFSRQGPPLPPETLLAAWKSPLE